MLHSLSLRAKILLPFIILMLAGFAVVVGYNSWAMRQHDLEQGVENARLQAAVLSTSINKTLNDGLSTTQTLTSTFETLRRSHVVNRDMLNKILARQLENHAGLLAVWTGWEPDALDGRDSEFAGQKPAHDDSGRFVPYWHRDAQGISVEPLVDYDKPGAGDYYLLPKQTGSLQVIEPYLYPVNGKPVMMTSIVAPLMVGITFSGVVGVDIALTDIANEMAKVKPYETGYLSLLSGSGQWLAHPQEDKVGKPAKDELPAEALEAIKAGKPWQLEDANGMLHFFTPIKVHEGMTPWSLRVSVERAQLLANADRARNAALLLGAGACLATLLLCAVLLGWLTRPLVGLAEAVEVLAQGEGDLTRRLPVNSQDEIGRTSAAFNRFMDKLRDMFAEVKQHAATLETSLVRLGDTTQAVAGNARQQADAASSTAATVEEVSSSISQIADGAQQAARAAEDTGELSEQLAELVQDTAGEIRQAASAVEALSGTLSGLGERSQQIASIVDVIRDIADQTNLLALNAAIEAARAGEQGRGFAVVADEVRKLAERTASATLEIATMIQTIQRDMQAATQGMGTALGRISSGVAHSEDTAEAIAGIHNTMANMVNRIRDIARATEEQSVASQDISSHVEHINHMSQQTDQQIHVASEETAQLRALGQQLEALVQRFRT